MKIYRYGVLLLLFLPLALAGQGRLTDDLNREAIQLAKEGHYKEAITKLHEAIGQDDRKSANSWHNLGFTYELAGEPDKAYGAYQEALNRNQSLVLTRSKVAKLQYDKGLYQDAVINGEKVLSVEPNNQEVIRWLPDAYRKVTQERLKTLPQTPTTPPKGEETKQAEKKPGVTYEFGTWVMGGGTYGKDSDSFDWHRQAGVTVVPMGMYASFHIDDTFWFRFDIANPYFGILTPRFMAGQQRMEYLYSMKSFYFGLGLLFTQINLSSDSAPGTTSFIVNRDYTSLSDTKFGLILGGRTTKRLLELAIYPRYLFRDSESGPRSNVFDAVRVDFQWRHRLDLFRSETTGVNPTRSGEFFLQFLMNEFYITEYKYNAAEETIGHWFGVYDIIIGMEFNSASSNTLFGFSLTERLYFRDIASENPASFGNGQGYFGFDTNAALEGNAFPGFRSNSHVVHFFMKHIIFTNFILHEKIGLEVTTPSEPVHAITLELGLAAKF